MIAVRDLGGTGLRVSEICLGTMNFGRAVDRATAFAIMDVAYAAGVTFFDTADVYPPPSGPALRGRAEEIVGEWLRTRAVRADVVVATKVGRPMGARPDERGLGRRHIMRACEASLRRLQTEYIDLYQVHVPDPDVPIEETLEALECLVRAGKVRHIGCSNFSASRLWQALAASTSLGVTRFECLQLRYNLLDRSAEADVLPLCRASGIGVLAYSPLAGGMLTDSRAASGDPVVAALRCFLAARGISLTHAALAWVLARPGVTAAIVGASRPEQLADTLRGPGCVLGDEERLGCDAVWQSISRTISSKH